VIIRENLLDLSRNVYLACYHLCFFVHIPGYSGRGVCPGGIMLKLKNNLAGIRDAGVEW